MEELDYPRFVFDKHQLEFETLESNIVEGIVKITPAEFKRKINVLEETQHKNKCPMVTGRQIMFQIFFFFNLNKSQGAR